MDSRNNHDSNSNKLHHYHPIISILHGDKGNVEDNVAPPSFTDADRSVLKNDNDGDDNDGDDDDDDVGKDDDDSTYKIISDAIEQDGFNINEEVDNNNNTTGSTLQYSYDDERRATTTRFDNTTTTTTPNPVVDDEAPQQPQQQSNKKRKRTTKENEATTKTNESNNNNNNNVASASSSSSSFKLTYQVPKRNRMSYFNTTNGIGKSVRLSKRTNYKDHMPIKGTSNRCLLCRCLTTVRCNTCQIQLCKYPFGTNQFSCYQIFHTVNILHPIQRNGATSKRSYNNNNNNNNQKDGGVPLPTSTTTNYDDNAKIVKKKTKHTTKTIVPKEQSQEEDEDSIDEETNQQDNNNDIIINPTPLSVIKIPKRNRMEFFNTKDGKKLRLTTTGPMDHITIVYSTQRCILCHCLTTVRCNTCQVSLCKYPFGTNQLSCYQIFHEKRVLKVLQRNGATSNQNRNSIQPKTTTTPATPAEPMVPINIPKRNRLNFYNKTVGRNIRRTAKSSMDHMPLRQQQQQQQQPPKKGGPSRCLLCSCLTTVRCGTCQVHLCRYPFGTNTISCFEIFHTEEVLIATKRNTGETSKQYIQPKGKQPTPMNAALATTAQQQQQQQQQIDPGNSITCMDCNNDTNSNDDRILIQPTIKKTKDMKRREQLQHRRKFKNIETTIVPLVPLPKRNRLSFFNKNNEWKQRRLTSINAMDHIPTTSKEQDKKASRCLLCRCITTVRCNICQVHLCKFSFGSNERSCFELFHTNAIVNTIERNGQHHKQKKATKTKVVGEMEHFEEVKTITTTTTTTTTTTPDNICGPTTEEKTTV